MGLAGEGPWAILGPSLIRKQNLHRSPVLSVRAFDYKNKELLSKGDWELWRVYEQERASQEALRVDIGLGGRHRTHLTKLGSFTPTGSWPIRLQSSSGSWGSHWA